MDSYTLIVAFLDVSFEFSKHSIPVIESKYKKWVFNNTTIFFLFVNIRLSYSTYTYVQNVYQNSFKGMDCVSFTLPGDSLSNEIFKIKSFEMSRAITYIMLNFPSTV